LKEDKDQSASRNDPAKYPSPKNAINS